MHGKREITAPRPPVWPQPSLIVCDWAGEGIVKPTAANGRDVFILQSVLASAKRFDRVGNWQR